MKGDLIKTFKIINDISYYDRKFFNISLWKFTVKTDFKY